MKTIEQRQIRQMAAPVLLNYLLLTIFETLDKSIVGHYSVQGFAVIGIAETPIYEITGALGVLSSAFSMIAAQLQGKKNTADFEQAFAVTRVVSWIIGLLFLLASCIGGRFFFQQLCQRCKVPAGCAQNRLRLRTVPEPLPQRTYPRRVIRRFQPEAALFICRSLLFRRCRPLCGRWGTSLRQALLRRMECKARPSPGGCFRLCQCQLQRLLL